MRFHDYPPLPLPLPATTTNCFCFRIHLTRNSVSPGSQCLFFGMKELEEPVMEEEPGRFFVYIILVITTVCMIGLITWKKAT